MGTLRTCRATTALAFSILIAAPTVAAAQEGGPGTIRVQPNLGTQSRDGFTVCTGTAQNRALYGSKVTSSTGIVTFTGIPFDNSVVTTVTKGGFTGREQAWLVPAPGSSREVLIYMFTGSGGPTCQGVSVIAAAAPPPPPASSSVGITVDPGSTSGRAGFYVCVGTSQNRAAYGFALTPATGPLTFANLPGSGMVKATIVRAGYTGVERDWYPNPGQSVALTVPVSPGSGGFTCPGYVAPSARVMRAAAPLIQQGEASLQAPSKPAVRVFDQYNNPMGGVPVTFSPTRETTRVEPTSVVTDSDGYARTTTWWLSPEPAVNEVTATMENPSTPVKFIATGVRSPSHMYAITPPSQQGVSGTPANQPPGVRVVEIRNLPVAGASVTFTPRAGSGSVSPRTVVTDSEGIARLTSWTLGSVGTNTVLAVVSSSLPPQSVGDLRVNFTATVLAPPTVAATTVIENPTAPPAARLGAELLLYRGDPFAKDMLNTYSCGKFGTNYVLVGLKVRHRVTTLIGIDLFCAALRADGTLGTPVYLPADAPTGGTAQDAVCGPGQAVVGYQGTLDDSDIRRDFRSIRLRCAALLPTGLSTGSLRLLAPLGIPTGPGWGPDMCTQGRPARALNTWRWDATVWALQLVCEQPTRGK